MVAGSWEGGSIVSDGGNGWSFEIFARQFAEGDLYFFLLDLTLMSGYPFLGNRIMQRTTTNACCCSGSVFDPSSRRRAKSPAGMCETRRNRRTRPVSPYQYQLSEMYSVHVFFNDVAYYILKSAYSPHYTHDYRQLTHTESESAAAA